MAVASKPWAQEVNVLGSQKQQLEAGRRNALVFMVLRGCSTAIGKRCFLCIITVMIKKLLDLQSFKSSLGGLKVQKVLCRTKHLTLVRWLHTFQEASKTEMVSGL